MTAARRWSPLDALVFSSVWLAAAAGALVAAASRGTEIAVSPVAVGLACSGTLVIYNIDRLRDLRRDRASAPLRSAFVSRHRRALIGLTVGAGATSAVCAATAGWPALALLPVLCVGLFHRRLKRFAIAKAGYISVAWLSVVVGLPALLDPRATRIPWAAAILGTALAANAVASNIRDREAVAAQVGLRTALWAARACAALGVALGTAAPAPANTLVAVPAATLLSLVAFRDSERYGFVAVDGALLAGALIAIAWT